ncbi:MAG: hypothetical protein ACYDCO_09460 [Armatimonadota bacterium]
MALTPAEKQRRYRERKASATVTLPRAEHEALQAELDYLRAVAAAESGWTAAVERLGEDWGQRQPLQYTRWLFSIERRVDERLREQNAIGILDKRYDAVRNAYAQALTESFTEGEFPLKIHPIDPEK